MAAPEPRINIHLPTARFNSPTGNRTSVIAHISNSRIAASSQLSNHRFTEEVQSVSLITFGGKQQQKNAVQSLQIRYILPTTGKDDQKVLHDRYLNRPKYKLQRRTSDKLSTTVSITQRNTRGSVQEAKNKVSTLQTSSLSNI